MAAITVTRDPDYTDLDLDFHRNRVTDDVNVLVGYDAIKRSVANLVKTAFYERPFRPWIGSPVRKLLFDNVNALTATFIRDGIISVLANYEPRVTVLDVVVNADDEHNAYSISIYTQVKSTLVPLQIDTFLERVR